jgi:hypothetical protein
MKNIQEFETYLRSIIREEFAKLSVNQIVKIKPVKQALTRYDQHYDALSISQKKSYDHCGAYMKINVNSSVIQELLVSIYGYTVIKLGDKSYAMSLTEKEMRDFANADSIGRYYNQHIKGKKTMTFFSAESIIPIYRPLG